MGKMFVLLLFVVFTIMLFFIASSPPTSESGLAALPQMTSAIPDDPWFKSEVVDSALPVLVDFRADWCGPCARLEPELEQLQEKYAGKFKLVALDTDQHRELAQHYSANAIPMMVLFSEGKPVGGGVGFAEFPTLEKTFGPLFDQYQPK